jgi:hypothetical protein
MWSTIVAGAGGWVILLKSKDKLTIRNSASAFLFHGLTGSAIGFIGYHYDLLWKGKQGVAFAVAQAYGVGLVTVSAIKPLVVRALSHGVLGGTDEQKE